MSQLSLFDAPPEKPQEDPKPPKPRPKPIPEPAPPDTGPIHATAEETERPNWQCIIIGCASVTMGAEIEGHPICDQHNTDETRAVISTGAWPAWYGYEGKYRVVPTVRRLDNLGHSWSGIGRESQCGNCGLKYDAWHRKKFETPCDGYEQPNLTEGLFKP